MAEKWKLLIPKVGEKLYTGAELASTVDQALKEDRDITGFHFTDGVLEETGGKTAEFSCCVFEHCRFDALDFQRISFSDCVFIKCELSNVRLENAVFQRVHIQNCRMTGMELLRGVLMSVRFENCMMDYFSMSEIKLDRVEFWDCRMRESLWADIRMPKVLFEHVDLSRAQWIRTPLNGLDLSSCSIEGWSISLYDLKGAKVTAAQVIDLSGLLGVEIVP